MSLQHAPLKCSLEDENGSFNIVKQITYNHLDYSLLLSRTGMETPVILVLDEGLEKTFEWKALTQDAKSARIIVNPHLLLRLNTEVGQGNRYRAPETYDPQSY